MREFFTIAIFKIKADIRMNKTTLNSQKEKHSILSLRRATSVALPGLRLHLNFYPRSPCGERQPSNRQNCRAANISIHALLAESDTNRRELLLRYQDISIHALLAESDASTFSRTSSDTAFLSTLSLRRATGHRASRDRYKNYFYPRSPCGERHVLERFFPCVIAFLSTLSLRRATYLVRGQRPNWGISIHALLAESDRKQSSHHKKGQ